MLQLNCIHKRITIDSTDLFIIFGNINYYEINVTSILDNVRLLIFLNHFSSNIIHNQL